MNGDILETAKPFINLMKAEVLDKIVWSMQQHWGSFYALDETRINDFVSINDIAIESLVYNKIISQYRTKPILLIHNGLSSMDYFMLTYLFFLANLKIPYRLTPLNKIESLFM
jgi:hypothetical protein